ncbi:hypothetical protein D3C76_1660530 [compost metagenome]
MIGFIPICYPYLTIPFYHISGLYRGVNQLSRNISRFAVRFDNAVITFKTFYNMGHSFSPFCRNLVFLTVGCYLDRSLPVVTIHFYLMLG